MRYVYGLYFVYMRQKIAEANPYAHVQSANSTYSTYTFFLFLVCTRDTQWSCEVECVTRIFYCVLYSSYLRTVVQFTL